MPKGAPPQQHKKTIWPLPYFAIYTQKRKQWVLALGQKKTKKQGYENDFGRNKHINYQDQ